MGTTVRNIKCVSSHVDHSCFFLVAYTGHSRPFSGLVNSLCMFGRMACMREYEHMKSDYASNVTRISGVGMMEDITDLIVIA
jgi:hypothetical protein